MISVGGVILPASAYVFGELSHGLPSGEYSSDIDGNPVLFTGRASADIDLVIPKASDGIKRSDALRLRDIAASVSEVTVIIGGYTAQAVFRYPDGAVALRPLNARQSQRDTDSYYGTIRLKEI